MARRIRPADVAQVLDALGYETSEHVDGDWIPGYRCAASGPRQVVVLHDGPVETDALTAYTTALRAAGYHVVPDRPLGTRHRLIITRP